MRQEFRKKFAKDKTASASNSNILPRMINGAHFLLYSSDPDADRTFLKDILNFRFVDVGHGWLIFGLPPSEIAVHPAEKNFAHAEGEQSMAGTLLATRL